MANHGATIPLGNFENFVVEVDWAAQIAGSVLYGEWQVAPAEGGIAEAGVKGVVWFIERHLRGNWFE